MSNILYFDQNLTPPLIVVNRFLNSSERPQFLADIWRCNDEIIKFIIRKFGEDLHWPDYHLRTAIFRILAENKLHVLVELKSEVNFDGILYQPGFPGRLNSVLEVQF